MQQKQSGAGRVPAVNHQYLDVVEEDDTAVLLLLLLALFFLVLFGLYCCRCVCKRRARAKKQRASPPSAKAELHELSTVTLPSGFVASVRRKLTYPQP